MTTAYTNLLGLALPVTGELDGTWGDTVNDYITQYTDASVAGTQTISGNQTAVTLSVSNGSSLTQVGGAGITGSSQYAIINCTGNPASTLTITAPAASKGYIVINATSTSQSVIVCGAGPTTGVTLATGEKAILAWDGSDFVKIASFLIGTSGGVPYYSTTGNISSSAALAANSLVIGGGAGVAPSTTTTGTGVVTALGQSANSASGLVTGTGTVTLQNKRIDPRISSTASATTLTPDISSYDQYCFTALAAGLTINAPIGSPLDGDKLLIRILDDGTSRTLTWNATYTVIATTLPTATTANKTTYVGCIYNAANTRWDVVASLTQL